MEQLKKSFAIFVLIALPFFIHAQDKDTRGYEIDVTIEGVSNSDLYLGFHYGNRQFIKDTIRLDENGHGVFRGPDNLDQGIYLVITPEKKYFEILIGEDQHFSLNTRASDLVNTLDFSGSEINEAFNEYQRFMMTMTQRKNQLQQKIQGAGKNQDSTQIWQNQLNELNQQVETKWESLASEYEGSILAAIIRAMKNPEIPDFQAGQPGQNKDSAKWAHRYRYYKNHFFDNIDLSDPRMVRTPIFHNKLEQYFNNILEQRPDSIISRIDWVIEQTRGSEDNYQYTVRYLLNHYQKSNIMGMDKVFVHIAEKYYLSGKAEWVDSTTLEKIQDRVRRIKPNLIGKKAPSLELVGRNGKSRNLHNLNSQYTILYFWEPSCSHCKKVTPEIYKLFEKYNRDQLQVFAVYTQGDKKEWTRYINDNGFDWINVYDPGYTSSFRQKYDVYSTPTIYLLDEDKTIVAKRIGHESLKKMLEQKLN
ncbi:MAG TPA: thioredoxin-like domain-containing protein [Bacteroidales bacterium]|nr:thioredoxin-like domain-containing protein [Bacteroidales bacterium]